MSLRQSVPLSVKKERSVYVKNSTQQQYVILYILKIDSPSRCSRLLTTPTNHTQYWCIIGAEAVDTRLAMLLRYYLLVSLLILSVFAE